MSSQGKMFSPEPRERTETPAHHVALLGGEGIIMFSDLEGLKAGTRRVWDLMSDGMWHDAPSVRLAAGDGLGEASEGLRRMRELRDLLPEGWTITKRSVGGRLFKYRIVEVDDE